MRLFGKIFIGLFTLILAVSCASQRPDRTAWCEGSACPTSQTYAREIFRTFSNHTVNLVCHGHSVLAGYFKTPEVRTFDAYPYLLHRD